MAAKKKAQEPSTNYKIMMAICEDAARNAYERVKHPVRFEMGMAYAIIFDLLDTYHWNPGQIVFWFKFAR